jgi:hypothetical protein
MRKLGMCWCALLTQLSVRLVRRIGFVNGTLARRKISLTNQLVNLERERERERERGWERARARGKNIG